jgi:hypothetical protein
MLVLDRAAMRLVRDRMAVINRLVIANVLLLVLRDIGLVSE